MNGLGALDSLLDWVLFVVVMIVVLYAAIIFVNMLVLLFRGMGFTMGAIFSRILLYVAAFILAYWALWVHLHVF